MGISSLQAMGTCYPTAVGTKICCARPHDLEASEAISTIGRCAGSGREETPFHSGANSLHQARSARTRVQMDEVGGAVGAV